VIRLAITALSAVFVVAPASADLAVAVARPAVVAVGTSWHGWVRDEKTGEVFGGAKGYRFASSCSGAVINGSGYVVTAADCVDHEDGLLAMAVDDLAAVGRVRDKAAARQQLAERAALEGARPGSPVDRRIEVTRALGGGDQDVAAADVVAVDGGIAVLRVPRGDLPAVEVGPGDTPVGAPVLVLGYTGVIQHGRVTDRRGGLLEVSVGGTPGGPVVDERGRLAGVLVQPSPTLAAQATTLADVLAGRDVQAGLGPGDRDYRTGLDAYFRGDYDSAVEFLDAVAGANPEAARFRDMAVARGGAVPGNALVVVLLVLCAVAAVAAGACAFAVAARDRRMDTPTPPYGFPMRPGP
jgi:serine protease Do